MTRSRSRYSIAMATTKLVLPPTKILPPKGGLVLLLCLLAIHCGGTRPAIPPPPDVKAAPANAIQTSSCLSYIVLVEGWGKTPGPHDEVTLHYTGWTTDGAMFDSSVARDKIASFKVDALIAGWTEALQLMKEGGQYRLWIPEALAYQGEKGFPEGMLVFQVELITVLR